MENNKLRAFNIETKSNILSNTHYVVIGKNFAEAEDIYWKELHGYYDIISITEISCENAGYRNPAQINKC